MDTAPIIPDERAPERVEQRDKGFTLVELLIVIVILGILSAVVVIAVGGITDRGQTSSCDADERALRTAAEAHLAEEGTYPANEGAIVTAGYLNEESTLHNYTFDSTAGTYTITGVGACVVPTTTTTTTP